MRNNAIFQPVFLFTFEYFPFFELYSLYHIVCIFYLYIYAFHISMVSSCTKKRTYSSDLPRYMGHTEKCNVIETTKNFMLQKHRIASLDFSFFSTNPYNIVFFLYKMLIVSLSKFRYNKTIFCIQYN